MSLRVMSFNIRYAEPTDGPDIWEFRRPICRDLILETAPDVIGMQEPEIEQLRDMDLDLSEYLRLGVSRYGNEVEKFAPIYFKPSRLELLETGAYWFSKTPDVPATMDWNIHKPYAVNWARFIEKSTGQLFALHNAQFPYKAEQAEARLHAAELMVQYAAAQPSVILTGDFNCDADGDVYRCLRSRFQDSIHAGQRLGPNATFHGFTGNPTKPYRLDWILYRGCFSPVRYETLSFHRQGHYPSDHFPVMVDLEIVQQTPQH